VESGNGHKDISKGRDKNDRRSARADEGKVGDMSTIILAKMYGVNPASGTTTQHGLNSDWLQISSKTVVNLYRTTGIGRRIVDDAAAVSSSQLSSDANDLASIGAIVTSPVAIYKPPTFTGVFYDDFERAGPGLYDAEHSFWGVGGSAFITTDQARSGTRSAMLGNGYVMSYQTMYPFFDAFDDLNISFDHYMPSNMSSSNSFSLTITGNKEAPTCSIIIGFSLSGSVVNMGYYDGPDGGVAVPLAPDAWHRITISNVDWDAKTFSLTVDGVTYNGVMWTGQTSSYYFRMASKGSYIDNLNYEATSTELVSAGTPILVTPTPEPVPIIPPFDISKFDFSIEVDFMLNNLFKWIPYTDGLPNYEVQYYGILGQFDQDANGEIIEGGNYWSLYLRVNADYTTDVIFEVFDQGAIAIQLVHRTEIAWSAWNEITKTNLDEYLHIAVSRQGYDMRLFVNGQYSDVAGSTGSLEDDFTTINGDWQIMGPSGQGDMGQPLSVTSVKNLVVHDEAYYWDDYVYEDWVRGTGISLPIALRMRFIEGTPGRIRARLAI